MPFKNTPMTLAERDQQINELNRQIKMYNNFLGGTKLTKEEINNLRTLESYLKYNGRGGKHDFAAIKSLLNEK